MILSLSPNILWELDCLFCPTNAARSSISSATDALLFGSQALKNMFMHSKSCYPDDSQAEVLVNSHIPSKYIQSVFLEKEMNSLSNLNVEVVADSFYFHNRDYALRNFL